MISKQEPLENKDDIAVLDKQWSEAIKAKGQCEYCLKRNLPLHAHHIIHRGIKDKRYILENGCCLCYYCHNLVHSGRIDLVKFLTKRRGQDWHNKLFG